MECLHLTNVFACYLFWCSYLSMSTDKHPIFKHRVALKKEKPTTQLSGRLDFCSIVELRYYSGSVTMGTSLNSDA